MNKYVSISCIGLLIFSSNVLAETKNKGDRVGHVMTAPIPAEEIPPAPVLTVEKALGSMHLQDGFVLENVAAEPMVQSPIAMVFNGNGGMWVVEMTTYMPDLDGNNEEVKQGNIVLVEDTNGNGKADKRTVLLDDVLLPRAIAMVKGGILYADHEQLYFAQVLAGNKLGIHEVVDPIYAQGGNVEHKPNAMLYGLDNWYYNAKSNRRYKVLNLDQNIPKDSEEIYRNTLWKMVVSNTESRGQWGLSTDDYGRLFHNGNSSAAEGEYLKPNSLMKNPGLPQGLRANSIGTTRVFPVRINPGVNRAYLPDILIEEGANKGKLANFTGASGNQVYRGDQFPASFYNTVFTPEPAANLLTVRRIIEQQGKLAGEHVYPEAEILASTDERFRPVNLNTAPDGSLYIVDMYHGVIQHKEFLTTYLREQYESRGLDKNNRDMGRIYRLRWLEKPLGPQPQMLKQTPVKWVEHLQHHNGWWRDTARQLIVQNLSLKEDKNIIKALQRLAASKTATHISKISALWALEGLEALNLTTIQNALKDEHTKVKVSAIELSTRLPIKDHQAIASTLLELANANYEVALHVALVAGELNSPTALNALQKVLDNYSDLPFVKEAAISGLTGKEDIFYAQLEKTGDPKYRDFLAVIDKVGSEDLINSNVLNLETYAQDMYNSGKILYDGKASCFGCHGKDGKGIDNMGPPLVNSEWVNESRDTLAKVLLHGLMGPIIVNDERYEGAMVMPGFAASLNDVELADIGTYIRNNWGNKSGQIHSERFTNMRANTQDRQLPYQQQDFE